MVKISSMPEDWLLNLKAQTFYWGERLRQDPIDWSSPTEDQTESYIKWSALVNLVRYKCHVHGCENQAYTDFMTIATEVVIRSRGFVEVDPEATLEDNTTYPLMSLYRRPASSFIKEWASITDGWSDRFGLPISGSFGVPLW